MWISRKRHFQNLDMLAKKMDENHEFRKVCQCRECKWAKPFKDTTDKICVNRNSDNYSDPMSQFSSCEKCERR